MTLLRGAAIARHRGRFAVAFAQLDEAQRAVEAGPSAALGAATLSELGKLQRAVGRPGDALLTARRAHDEAVERTTARSPTAIGALLELAEAARAAGETPVWFAAGSEAVALAQETRIPLPGIEDLAADLAEHRAQGLR